MLLSKNGDKLGRRATLKNYCRGDAFMKTLKFACKLDVFRRLKGLTIVAMARKCDVDEDTMERLLSGRNAPNASNLLKIMRGLEITFEPTDFEEEGP